MKPHAFRGKGGLCEYADDEAICNLLPAADRHITELRAMSWPGSAQSVWQAHAVVVADLLKRKEAYGDAWKAQGYMGNIGRVLSKASRLRNLTWRDAHDASAKDYDTQQETLLDTLMDLSALCAFAISNIEEGNRWGS